MWRPAVPGGGLLSCPRWRPALLGGDLLWLAWGAILADLGTGHIHCVMGQLLPSFLKQSLLKYITETTQFLQLRRGLEEM